VLAAASEGRLTSQVAQVFSLDHAAEALNAAAAGGTGGKVIVRVA